MALKAAILCEIKHNDGHWHFKVTQVHRFCYRSKARMLLPISE